MSEAGGMRSSVSNIECCWRIVPRAVLQADLARRAAVGPPCLAGLNWAKRYLGPCSLATVGCASPSAACVPTTTDCG